VDISGEIFASGGDLKSSFCFIKNGLAYMSQYLGDMESVSCQSFYKREQQAMMDIFGFNPEAVVVDRHPAYFSRSENLDFASKYSLPTKEIQHHKAHVAAVIAEHKLTSFVLGFAFDGTGYGDDGTIWGSEVFSWNGGDLTRVAHLKPVRLIGGDEGAKNCDTILSGMLHSYRLDNMTSNPNHALICAALDKNINTVTSTSMGRLFDAVSAMLDVCHYNSYEGQAPIELENLAATTLDFYKLELSEDGDCKKLFEDIADALSKQVSSAEIARGFIYAISN
jgi:hydrogenase maturation protein HypF